MFSFSHECKKLLFFFFYYLRSDLVNFACPWHYLYSRFFLVLHFASSPGHLFLHWEFFSIWANRRLTRRWTHLLLTFSTWAFCFENVMNQFIFARTAFLKTGRSCVLHTQSVYFWSTSFSGICLYHQHHLAIANRVRPSNSTYTKRQLLIFVWFLIEFVFGSTISNALDAFILFCLNVTAFSIAQFQQIQCFGLLLLFCSL